MARHALQAEVEPVLLLLLYFIIIVFLRETEINNNVTAGEENEHEKSRAVIRVNDCMNLLMK